MILRHQNISIQPTNEEEKNIIFSSYSQSFPPEERRNEEQFYTLFINPKTNILSIFKNEILVGYLIIWELSNFTFVEHFEVFETHRGLNLGSDVLTILKQNIHNIILETEPENLNPISKRRVDFYERNGFKILDKTYIQPSYGDDKSPINLWLMGTFVPTNLSEIISEIHHIVYQV